MFCDRFKDLRKANRYTQNELAEQFNVSVQTIYNWESNIFLPGVETILEIAKFFHVSIDYLLGDYLFNLNDRNFIEVTGLTLEQIEHIQKTIEYIKEKQNK